MPEMRHRSHKEGERKIRTVSRLFRLSDMPSHGKTAGDKFGKNGIRFEKERKISGPEKYYR